MMQFSKLKITPRHVIGYVLSIIFLSIASHTSYSAQTQATAEVIYRANADTQVLHETFDSLQSACENNFASNTIIGNMSAGECRDGSCDCPHTTTIYNQEYPNGGVNWASRTNVCPPGMFEDPSPRGTFPNSCTGSDQLLVRCPSPYKYSTTSQTCNAFCPQGHTWDPNNKSCIAPAQQTTSCGQSLNPIDFISGHKYRRETVLAIGPVFPIEVIFYYNNQGNDEKTANGLISGQNKPQVIVDTIPPISTVDYGGIYNTEGFPIAQLSNTQQFYGNYGRYWRHNYDEALVTIEGSIRRWYRYDGINVAFNSLGVSNEYPEYQLQPLTTDEVQSLGFDGHKITDRNILELRFFDEVGKLRRIAQIGGVGHNLTYDTENRLARIQHDLGDFVDFTYDISQIYSQYGKQTAAFVTQLNDSAGRRVDIGWNHSFPGNAQRHILLTSYTAPYIGTAISERSFIYSSYRWPASVTQIDDIVELATNTRKVYARFQYDNEGRAISSGLAENVESINVIYNSDSVRTVRNALGKDTTYTFDEPHGVRRLASIRGEASEHCQQSDTVYVYDGLGNATRTTQNGVHLDRQYNDRGLEISRTEAVGTPDARLITTEWHADYPLPLSITDPVGTTIFTYDAQGRMLSQSRQAQPDGSSQTTQYSYNAHGQVTLIDGPRTDVNDHTHFTYNAEGRLTELRNALGHTRRFEQHNGLGQPTRVVDENGTVMTLGYDELGRLTSDTITPAGMAPITTTYTYDPLGNLTGTQWSDGSRLNYSYDLANRLIAVENNLGERLDYTLDAQGNIVDESISDSQGTLRFQIHRSFDRLSRIHGITTSANNETSFTYDADNFRTALNNGRNLVTHSTPDALDRIVMTRDPNQDEMHFTYDSLDRLTSVTDDRNLSTLYQYDVFNNLTQLSSPDTGNKTYSYDSAKNRLSQTDARNVVTQYSYDALNRVTSMAYPSAPAENVTYHYDDTSSGNVGIGQLTGIDDESGSIQWRYDALGNPISQQYTIGNQAYNLTYGYDAHGRMNSITYPDGRELHYIYDILGRISALHTRATSNAALTPVVTDISYLPFGPIAGYLYGNGLEQSNSFDQDYRLTSLRTFAQDANGVVTNTLIDRNFAYDGNNNIINIDEANQAFIDQLFTYDLTDRIATADGLYGDLSFLYDGVGNRQSLTAQSNTNTQSLNYSPVSQRLETVNATGQPARTFQYDAVGNMTHDSSRQITLHYNAANRPHQADTPTGQVFYTHNALGQRTIKSGPLGTEHYHYDIEGKLLAISNSQGQIRRTFIYLGSQLVAINDAASTYFVHNDHIGTPQVVSNANQNTVWKVTHQTPFGQMSVSQDPDGDGQELVLNIRFPGQYFDSETGYHYNWHRTYDPSLGRYLQSDPLGLYDGPNTYSYAYQNSLKHADPTGLFVSTVDAYCIQDPISCGQILSGLASPGGPNPQQQNCGSSGGLWAAAATAVTAAATTYTALKKGHVPPHIGAGSKNGKSLYNPGGGKQNCVGGVCAFLNTINTGQLHQASNNFAWNGGSIQTALRHIRGQTGLVVGSTPLINALASHNSRQFFVVFVGANRNTSDHVLVGILNNGRRTIFDPQSGQTYKNIERSFPSFTAWPVGGFKN